MAIYSRHSLDAHVPLEMSLTQQSTSQGTVGYPLVRRFRDFFDPFEETFFQSIAPFTSGTSTGRQANALTAASHMEIIDKPDHYQVNIELPGCRRQDISVEMEGNRLYVNASKQEEHRGEGERTYWSERVYGAVRRTVELPSGIDPSKMMAKYEEGVLKVMLGKRPEASSKQRVTIV